MVKIMARERPLASGNSNKWIKRNNMSERGVVERQQEGKKRRNRERANEKHSPYFGLSFFFFFLPIWKGW
jgi:hypothetical protein